jgi:hypothetical protein
MLELCATRAPETSPLGRWANIAAAAGDLSRGCRNLVAGPSQAASRRATSPPLAASALMSTEKGSLEVLGAVATLLATPLAFVIVLFPNSRLAAAVVLLATLLGLGIWAIKRRPQAVMVIHGYARTIEFLQEIVLNAERSVWTVRTHIGEATAEEPLFTALANRVRDTKRPLEDVRRNIGLTATNSTRTHLRRLVNDLSDQAAVKVKYFLGGGAKYDFIIVDGQIAVIGLPRSEGDQVGASLVIKDKIAVRCIESAFEDLWRDGVLVFAGQPGTAEGHKQRILDALDGAIQALPAGSSPPTDRITA